MSTKRKHRLDINNDIKIAYMTVLKDTKNHITSLNDLTEVLSQTGRNLTLKLSKQFWKEDTTFITYDEFIEICKEISPTSSDDLMKAFNKMDINGDGFISREEFLAAMTSKGEQMTMKEVVEIMDKVDKNKDGKLDFAEFTELLLSNVEECKRTSKENLIRKGVISAHGKRPISGRSIAGPSTTPSIINGDDSDNDDIIIGSSQGSLRRSNTPKNDNEVLISKTINVNSSFNQPPGLSGYLTKCQRRGCFVLDKDENDDIVISSQGYEFNLTKDSTVFITMAPLSGLKLLEFKKNPDLGFLLLKNETVLGVSEEFAAEELVAITMNLTRGRYSLVPFTSGTRLKPRKSEPKTTSRLIKKNTNKEFALTTGFKEALADIFHMADMDGNGSLNKEELNQYVYMTCGEMDDSIWSHVQNTYKLQENEMSYEDFEDMTLKEAQEDAGDPENLWISLDNYGFNRQLIIDQSFPYVFHINIEKCSDVEIKVLEAEKSSECNSTKALIDYVQAQGNKKNIPDSEGASVYTLTVPPRALVVVEGSKTAEQAIVVEIDSSESTNFIVKSGRDKVQVLLQPKETELLLHGVAKDSSKTVDFECVVTKR